MLNTTERMQKILAASQKTLARVDQILTGEDTSHAPVDQDNRLVTYTDAARRLGVSRPTVYALVRTGRLDTIALNGVSRITVRSIDALANGQREIIDTTETAGEAQSHRSHTLSANRQHRHSAAN